MKNVRQLAFLLHWALIPILASTAQTPATPSFEVASVKRSPTQSSERPDMGMSIEEKIRFLGGPGTRSPERINYNGVTLKMLLMRAYQLKQEMISGPNWMDTERYDIVAKVPIGTTKDQLRIMLQQLLKERFSIQSHFETKKLPVYLLTLAAGGPKFKSSENTQAPSLEEMQLKASKELEKIAAESSSGPQRRLHLPNSTTAKFAESLSSHLEFPVQDKTGLEGTYSFTLKWNPDNFQTRSEAGSSPSIFVALVEQLGLKLQRDNQEVQALKIDKAEKLPTSN